MISRNIYFTGATAGGFASVRIPLSLRPSVLRAAFLTMDMTIAAAGSAWAFLSPSQDVLFFTSDGPAKLAVVGAGGPAVAQNSVQHVEVYFHGGFPVSQNIWIHGSCSGVGNSCLGWAILLFDDN